MSGGRDKANLVIRCHFCKRESSLDIVDGPFPYKAESSGSLATVLILDCRGAEPTNFEPRGAWRATGAESTTVFDEVDITDKDGWVDYDDKAELPVSIKYLGCSFVTSKLKDIKKDIKKNKAAVGPKGV
ncbi:hypothetical protein GGI21_002308 [Coemansia aciculifera]|nr:hypothetical protein GGI21_002308 [Coemansia aciculifera]